MLVPVQSLRGGWVSKGPSTKRDKAKTNLARIAVLASPITVAPKLRFLTVGCCKQYLEMKVC
ncbi:hypothetical protein DPMN_015091 [Dreissena polymorpha]|uniref:Uncharacterized protein n=1 Tax=Dreissena polymorpha TaxID=45954 RepID=A0A9D4S566_DREPO|nr:hypothetical protein DPMN_015091 [Dreissena polymorpha]